MSDIKFMKAFKIKYTRNDMPKGYVGTFVKWAHTDKDAVRLILAKAAAKDGSCTFKRGGSGKIISVEEYNGDDRDST